MSFSTDIKQVRLNSFLTQEEFAKELDVTVMTINRWERGKTKPTLKTMKKIDTFCKRNSIDFDIRMINEEGLQ